MQEIEPDTDFIETEDLPSFRYRTTELDQTLEQKIAQEKVESHYVVPDVVKQFVTYFHRHIRDGKISDINSMYENTFNKITEKYFKATPWPPADAIAPLVNNDALFLILYRELYYRHIYGLPKIDQKLGPSIEQRFDSWKNYCDFFGFVIDSGSDFKLDLPNQWLWDIMDEFIYQYQSFCQYRAKLKNKNAEELSMLKSNPQVWNSLTVINYLQTLINKSGISQILEKSSQESTLSAFPLLRKLGYFSIICLQRVHVLLGDYDLALRTISRIELNGRGWYTQVTACHITLYYYTGFIYMMMRRYFDAIKTFSNMLLFISRTKQFHTRSYQYEQIMKKNEQMYGLLAICIYLCPTRVDENVHAILREKYSDKMLRMQRGDMECFEEVFTYACPKFISPVPPHFGSPEEVHNYSQDALRLQTKVFLNEVKQQVHLPTIRSFLKLYTTIEISKLADFLEQGKEEQQVARSLMTLLLCFKHKSRSLVWSGGSPSSGEMVSTSDVDFYIDQKMIHIHDQKTIRRYSEFFIRHINRFEEITKSINHSS